MVSSKLKKRFEAAITPLVKPLASTGLTANTVTVLGVLASLASAWCYLNWRTSRAWLVYAGALILFSGLLDAIDGVLARTTGKVTAFGGFFDSVADRYSDAIVLSGVIVGGLCDPIWGLAALTGSLMVSYTRSRAEAAGVAMAGVGFFERAERMLLLALVSFAGSYRLELMNWGVGLLAVVAHLTVAQRALHFKKTV